MNYCGEYFNLQEIIEECLLLAFLGVTKILHAAPDTSAFDKLEINGDQ